MEIFSININIKEIIINKKNYLNTFKCNNSIDSLYYIEAYSGNYSYVTEHFKLNKETHNIDINLLSITSKNIEFYLFENDSFVVICQLQLHQLEEGENIIIFNFNNTELFTVKLTSNIKVKKIVKEIREEININEIIADKLKKSDSNIILTNRDSILENNNIENNNVVLNNKYYINKIIK